MARVVLAPLLGVGEDGVGGGQLLELGLALDLVALVAVGVVLEGQLVVGMLDGVEIGTGRELEQRVVVLLPALQQLLRKRLLAWQGSDPSPLVFHFRVAWMIDSDRCYVLLGRASSEGEDACRLDVGRRVEEGRRLRMCRVACEFCILSKDSIADGEDVMMVTRTRRGCQERRKDNAEQPVHDEVVS